MGRILAIILVALLRLIGNFLFLAAVVYTFCLIFKVTFSWLVVIVLGIILWILSEMLRK